MKLFNHQKLSRFNTRNWKTTDRTDRLYIFVDESGDPGLPINENSSSYFFINVLVCNTDGLNKLEKHFSRYRYFRNADKEFKRYRNNGNNSQAILDDLCVHLSGVEGIAMYSFYLNKETYISSYLEKVEISPDDYNATKFRNFITRKALEKIFEYVPVVKNFDEQFRSIEIIFDRYLENTEDDNNLKSYLTNSYGLPRIQFINQIDSLYCSQLQIVDVIGSLVRRTVLENTEIEVGFIRLFEMFGNNEIKEKDPDTTMGTGSFSSMNL